jgi:hypothetical protein
MRIVYLQRPGQRCDRKFCGQTELVLLRSFVAEALWPDGTGAFAGPAIQSTCPA